MPKTRTASEELFALVLRHWQELPSEREKARFFLAVLADERFADLLPFMVDATLKHLDRKETGRGGGSRSKLPEAKERNIGEVFWAAADEWEKKHPGASGLTDAQRAWRFAVGRAAARTGADPRTIKRRFPDPLEKARARGRALTQALREWTPKSPAARSSSRVEGRAGRRGSARSPRRR
jgi:hypothetical protein